MTRLRVDLAQLADVVDRMQALADHLDRVRVEVAARCADVTWRGAAADSYAAAHERWAAGTEELRHALTALRSAGSTAHGNYAATVVANRRMWSG